MGVQHKLEAVLSVLQRAEQHAQGRARAVAEHLACCKAALARATQNWEERASQPQAVILEWVPAEQAGGPLYSLCGLLAGVQDGEVKADSLEIRNARQSALLPPIPVRLHAVFLSLQKALQAVSCCKVDVNLAVKLHRDAQQQLQQRQAQKAALRCAMQAVKAADTLWLPCLPEPESIKLTPARLADACSRELLEGSAIAGQPRPVSSVLEAWRGAVKLAETARRCAAVLDEHGPKWCWKDSNDHLRGPYALFELRHWVDNGSFLSDMWVFHQDWPQDHVQLQSLLTPVTQVSSTGIAAAEAHEERIEMDLDVAAGITQQRQQTAESGKGHGEAKCGLDRQQPWPTAEAEAEDMVLPSCAPGFIPPARLDPADAKEVPVVRLAVAAPDEESCESDSSNRPFRLLVPSMALGAKAGSSSWSQDDTSLAQGVDQPQPENVHSAHSGPCSTSGCAGICALPAGKTRSSPNSGRRDRPGASARKITKSRRAQPALLHPAAKRIRAEGPKWVGTDSSTVTSGDNASEDAELMEVDQSFEMPLKLDVKLFGSAICERVKLKRPPTRAVQGVIQEVSSGPKRRPGRPRKHPIASTQPKGAGKRGPQQKHRLCSASLPPAKTPRAVVEKLQEPEAVQVAEAKEAAAEAKNVVNVKGAVVPAVAAVHLVAPISGCARLWTYEQWRALSRLPGPLAKKGRRKRRKATDASDALALDEGVKAVKGRGSRGERDLLRDEVLLDGHKWAQLKASDAIRFGRSKVHAWGVFANRDIPAQEVIVEYTGELIRSIVADLREAEYERKGLGSTYLFRINRHWVVDATHKGGLARYINHSCEPNCYTKTVRVDGTPHIVIYSKRNIRPGEELLYDYMLSWEEGAEDVPCLCGAAACRGTL